MNQLPISLTLHYPTTAQFEAYLGFMAMLSIAASMAILSFPLWLWCARKTISRENSIMPLVFSLNPVGCVAVIITGNDLGSGVSGAIGWTIFFAAPFIIMIPFII